MSHSSLAIANKILQVAGEKGMPLTIMQLIKLVYLAHGWTLALLNKPLVEEPVEAWQHGPVYPGIYREFRGVGWQPIERMAIHPFSGTTYEANISDDEASIIDEVVTVFGKFHAFELSARTHQPGTPWHQTYDDGRGQSRQISNSLIKAEFDRLREKAA
jgi:uncharacterized phage-associated protein